MSAHIDYKSKKISSALGGLKQLRLYVPVDTVIAICRSMILPLFDYCDVVWASLNKGIADRMQQLQNGAARIITRCDYDTRTAEILGKRKVSALANLDVFLDNHEKIINSIVKISIFLKVLQWRNNKCRCFKKILMAGFIINRINGRPPGGL